MLPVWVQSSGLQAATGFQSKSATAKWNQKQSLKAQFLAATAKSKATTYLSWSSSSFDLAVEAL